MALFNCIISGTETCPSLGIQIIIIVFIITLIVWTLIWYYSIKRKGCQHKYKDTGEYEIIAWDLLPVGKRHKFICEKCKDVIWYKEGEANG